jgi:diguanylate cyclase (GGDEF)-like protein
VQDGIGGRFRNSSIRHGSYLTDSKKTLWLRLKRHFAESFAGELLPQQREPDEGLVDEVRDRRRRGAYRYIFLLLTVVLLPLVANNIYLNQPLPLIAALLLLAVLVLNIVLLSLNREAFLSPPIVVGISIALLIMSLYLGQNYNLYLLFPLLVALPILLKTRDAIILGVFAGLVTAPVVLAQHDLTTAAAIGLGMGLTWLASAWLVFAMNEQSRRLKDLAITDSLTGAFNRRYLELQAARCLQDWERHQRSVSLLLLDIDNFKKINDEFGHSVGDAALKSLVNLVKERIRGVDTLCRYGGEEFVLLLSETTAAQAKIVANQLRRAVEQAEVLPWGTMTISIGVCDVRQVPDLETWFSGADAALYAAKDLGRNRVELAEPLATLAPESERAHWRTYAGRR